MDINATLIVQMFTFALFVLFTMKFVWPPIMKALEERQNTIAEGLSAAERGHKELELAKKKATSLLKEAKVQAADIVEHANRRAGILVDEAKNVAKEEGQRLVILAEEQIKQKVNHAKTELCRQVASLAIEGAEKVIGRSIDVHANNDLLDDLIKNF